MKPALMLDDSQARRRFSLFLIFFIQTPQLTTVHHSLTDTMRAQKDYSPLSFSDKISPYNNKKEPRAINSEFFFNLLKRF